MSNQKGFLVIFNGIISSGKTTLSKMTYEWLAKKGVKNVKLLDSTKDFWGHDTDYSIDGRFDALKKAAYGAYLLSDSGVNVLLCVIIGKDAFRQMMKRRMKFCEIYLDADIDDCIKNDPQGIYKEYIKRKDPQVIGYDQIFEKPEKPDLVVKPYKESVEKSFEKIKKFFEETVLKI